MYKEGMKVTLKEDTDVVRYGWFSDKEELSIVNTINVNNSVVIKEMYIVENEEGVRVLVYDNDIDEVIN